MEGVNSSHDLGALFRGLIISRICDKFSGIGLVENYGTVGKFHKKINFFLNRILPHISKSYSEIKARKRE